jgi:pimeloyl-ACP methyl ester carboxylesterase
MSLAPPHAVRSAAAALAAVLLLAAACGDDAGPSPTPTPEPAATVGAEPTPAVELSWQECRGVYECATLEVPLVHDDPSAGTIDLALMRYPAADPERRVGSLLINPGGPGSSGVEFLQTARGYLPRELFSRFDVVGFDPRGVGDSTAIDCVDDLGRYFDLDPAPTDEAGIEEMIALTEEFVEACERNNPRLLPHVGTEAAARDMELIRLALDEDRISYLGFSYGTLLGAMYADLYPEHVRAFALDGGIDPALDVMDLLREQTLGFEMALNAFLGDCAANPGCAFHSGGDPRGAYVDLKEEIRREPVPVPGSQRTVGPGEAFVAVLAGMYESEFGWPLLAQGLALADQGDGTVLLRLYDLYLDHDGRGNYGNSLEASAAINCVDAPVPRDVDTYRRLGDELAAEAPLLGRAGGWFGLTCALWPVEATGEPRPLVAEGSAPILVVGTTGDPATPYEWSVALAEQLDAGVLLTYEGDGHTAFGRGNFCVDDAIVAYLVDLEVPMDGARC